MLTLPPEQMRSLGCEIIDKLIRNAQEQGYLAPVQVADWSALTKSLSEAPPELPQEAQSVLERLYRDVLPYRAQISHTRFFPFVPGPSNFVSVLAELIATGENVFAGSWLGGSGPAVLELATVKWLAGLFGMPEAAGGLFLSGGSMANLTALVAARTAKLKEEEWGRGVVYCSDQTHFAVSRALRIVGFVSSQVRILPSDANFRLPPFVVAEAVRRDRADGLIPFCLVANAGTTNTGAVDPLPELADLCGQQGLWLHVDGAYGAAAILCEQGREALTGLERADSLAIDPHKWLFQPIDCGCLLVRNREHLRAAFHVSPEYLKDALGPQEEGSFWNYGPELTRPFRALKLWLSVQVFGVAAFRAAVERGFQLAELAESLIKDLPGWEIVTGAQMGVVTFRFLADDQANVRIGRAMLADGYAAVLSTALKGKTVLRMCPINPRTTDEEIRETVRRLALCGERSGR